MTNAEFAKEDGHFKNACEKAGIPPTSAQARKWRDKRGLAYLFQNEANLSRNEFEVQLSMNACKPIIR